MRIGAVAACLIAVALTVAPAAQQGKFKAGVELVSLNVSVSDGTKFITDINEAEFEVFEDGVKQPLTFFSRSQTPIALAILLDTSNSMEDKLATAQKAAVGFTKRLRAEDVAEVIGFSTQVRILQPFTTDMAAVEKAILETTADGSTALYNAIYISLKELRKVKAQTETEIRRQAIVVLSDGDDTYSLLPYEEVLDLAKRSETAIYTIGLRPQDLNRATFKEAEYVLRQLAQQTGGQSFFPTNVNELQKIYDTISQELSTMYTMAYSSKNPRRDGAWRRVIVRVNRPGLTTRTRQGYYAPGAGGS